ncbi:zinc finger protein 862-like [Dreissena polymorpha]|nr:zinc finger protein 862-like [Dreissena polymorpha]
MTMKERSELATNSPIVKATKRCMQITMNILVVMFNTVYSLAKKCKPLSDFETHMELHVKNKKDIGGDYMDIGTNYHNEKRAKEFLMSIGEQLRVTKTRLIEKVRFLTVLADGSTDSSMTEQNTVLVRYVSEGYPVTTLASIEDIENANAFGVKNGIENGLNKIGITDSSKIVSVNFDGAAVMMGCKSGVSALMKEKNPRIVSIHCVAHKLELGVLDAVRSIDYLLKFEDIVKSIYKFYARSTKRRRDLQAFADILESELLHYGDVKTVRWVASKARALRAIQQNLFATIGHLEHAASANKTEESGKAKKLLHEMKSARFVKYLHLMMDYLEIITATSKKFQQNKLLIMEVPDIIKSTTDELTLMIEEPGHQTSTFYDHYDPETGDFTDHGDHVMKLSGQRLTTYEEDNDKTTLLKQTVKYLEVRFMDFNEKPLKCFDAFNLNKWPTNDTEFVKHGRDDIKELTQHYIDILTDTEHSSMLREWTIMKNLLRKKKTGINCHDLYCELLQTQPADIQNILTLVNIMVSISPSSAECERQFSAMKLIKSCRRSHMHQDTLEALMRVHADGPPLQEYKAEGAIHHWMDCGPGTRHLAGHKISSASD